MVLCYFTEHAEKVKSIVGWVCCGLWVSGQHKTAKSHIIVENTVCMCNMTSLFMGTPRLFLSQFVFGKSLIFLQVDLHFDLYGSKSSPDISFRVSLCTLDQ